MSPAEWGLLFAMLAHSVAVIGAIAKLIHWFSRSQAISEQRIKQLEHTVNNDVTGRRVVGEMREDLAAIKTQVTDLKSDLATIHQKVDPS
jgi:predicted  nucleic acid-binding Zn-ribbon protein